MFFDFHSKSPFRTAFAAAQLLERTRWERNSKFQKISSSFVKTANQQQIQDVVGFSLQSLGCADPPARALTADLSDWWAGEQDYDFVQANVSELLGDLRKKRCLPEKVLHFSALLAAFGFFSLSLEFQELARDEIRKTSIQRGTIRDWIRRAQAEIAQGDFSAARLSIEKVRVLTNHSSYTKRIWEVIQPLVAYVDVWTGEFSESELGQRKGVSNLLIGPNKIDSDSIRSFKSLGRAFHLGGPGAFDFHKSNEENGLISEALYTINEDLDHMVRTSDGLRALEKYNFVGVKRSADQNLSNLRIIDNLAWLMLSGHANKAPIAAIDILHHYQSPIFVTGVSFFATPINYRVDAIRKFGKNIKTDSRGSRGGKFDRCGAFASHNLLENRALMRNLYLAGLMHGDKAFSTVMKLSDQKYARTLDDLYGKERR